MKLLYSRFSIRSELLFLFTTTYGITIILWLLSCNKKPQRNMAYGFQVFLTYPVAGRSQLFVSYEKYVA